MNQNHRLRLPIPFAENLVLKPKGLAGDDNEISLPGLHPAKCCSTAGDSQRRELRSVTRQALQPSPSVVAVINQVHMNDWDVRLRRVPTVVPAPGWSLQARRTPLSLPGSVTPIADRLLVALNLLGSFGFVLSGLSPLLAHLVAVGVERDPFWQGRRLRDAKNKPK